VPIPGHYDGKQVSRRDQRSGVRDGPQLPRVYVNPAADQHGGRRTVEAGRLWVGGLMVAIVAAGVAVVGLILARGIANVPVLVKKDGQLLNAETSWYAAAAFAGALVATGLLNVLLLLSPRPYLFFGWIIGLATAAAALLPYNLHAEFVSRGDFGLKLGDPPAGRHQLGVLATRRPGSCPVSIRCCCRQT
jgi:Family of unknown function (DUF6069)